MSKIVMKNVKINAKNGGTIKNYESVEMDSVEMNFTESSIDFLTDENVAILRSAIQSMSGEEVIALAKELGSSEASEQEALLKKSKLKVILGYVKDIKPGKIQCITRPASLAHAKGRMGWTSFHSAAAGGVSFVNH
jgi:hypothetical protein